MKAPNLNRLGHMEKSKPTAKRRQPPKGFVLVNLAAWQQKELRALAHESGMSLREALRFALIDMHSMLETSSRVKQLTGLRASEQYRFFNGLSNSN